MSRTVVLAVALLLVGASYGLASESAQGKLPPWVQCVMRIHDYFAPNASEAHWVEPNPCNYSILTPASVHDELLLAPFPRDATAPPSTFSPRHENVTGQTFTFSGDSTGFRAYIYSVNAYAPPPGEPLRVRRVAESPIFLETRNSTGSLEFAIRFYRLQYVSFGPSVIRDAVATSNGGMLFINGLGNWDMNWKMQLRSPMPGLVGGSHNFTAAKIYWTSYVQLTVESLREALLSMPPERRPIVIFREQALPNCAASRFANPKRRYRQCAPFLRPVLVPLYRRTLAPLLWSIGIPIIPIDPLFARRQCTMGDGLHIDCHPLEMQLVWNVYRLLRGLHVAQGEFLGGAQSIPISAHFLDESNYTTWRQSFFGEEILNEKPTAAAATTSATVATTTPSTASQTTETAVASSTDSVSVRSTTMPPRPSFDLRPLGTGAAGWTWTLFLALAVFVFFTAVTFYFVR